MTYVLNVTDLENVTEAGIHVGTPGQNGSLGVSLYKSRTTPSHGNGTLSQGNITSSDLEGFMEGMQLTQLLHIMQSGEAYVKCPHSTKSQWRNLVANWI